MSVETLPLILPSLPGHLDGVIGLDPVRLQCQECGRVGEGRTALAAIYDGGLHYHRSAWPDGTNPRLCRECRLARGCSCDQCRRERAGGGVR